MKLTEISLDNHVAVQVAILLTVLFGAVSLSRLPVQLIPEIQEPQITISTGWRAAAPNEVEAEIIEPQEDVLRGLPGMTRLLSTAQEGYGEITISFNVDVDFERALIEVLSRLNQVPQYPDDADEPQISSVGAEASPIAWIMVQPAVGNERDISSYSDYVKEVVQTRFERVQGVARAELRGGREREIRISFDPYKVASLGIQLPVVSALAGAGKDSSAGGADVGKREYSIRYAGKYGVDELAELIIEWRNGRPIYLRDVARVENRLADKSSFVRTNGGLTMAISVQREAGVNVLEVMEELQAAIVELREGPLKRAGLTIEQKYDETIYIESSIRMLRNNLGLGILLAVLILWWFLRRLRATIIVAAAVPVCLLGSFLVLYTAGRTLNIISLAGLALAVGMVMDASIVVLENIIRLREGGESPEDASLHGTGQIWGALLASTVTTVAIFLPIIFLQGEVGQLFGDLALTISAAICISLLIAVTVAPAFARQYLGKYQMQDPHAHWWRNMAGIVMRLTNTPRRRFAWIICLISLPVLIAILLLPKADYLPTGNRNIVFAFILPPPGASNEHMENEMGRIVDEKMRPYFSGEEPRLKHFFFVSFPGGAFMGLRAEDSSRAAELVPLLNQVLNGFPDVIAFARQASIFGRFGEGRTVDMDIQAEDLAATMQAALIGFLHIPRAIPGARAQPYPGLQLSQPELRLIPDERRIAEAGWNRGILANVIRALGDGLYVGDYFDGNKTLDIIVRAEPWEGPEELANMPLATPDAGILPLKELAEVIRTAGPEKIRRVDRRRTVTLRVQPPADMSLSETIVLLQERVAPVILEGLPEDGEINYTGTADKLASAIQSMQGGFLLAIAILYLLMSALFRSFKDSLLVILAIPLATVGGVIMLRLVNFVPGLLGINIFQPMDLLTMIGFIILLGLVVNNAILLVHQARQAERAGRSRKLAVEQAVSLRLRPIMMSTLTSVFGMLPLLLIPGAGTELYRGLAAVIVGGMMMSTVFTLILLPSLLRIGEGKTPATTARNADVQY